MSKTKFPRAAAINVVKELCAVLKQCCEPDRLIVAGSLRRRREEVGDVELVYIPRMIEYRDGLFAADNKSVSMADESLNGMLAAGVLAKRKNVNGSEMWGQKNKLALHIASGIPVDFFATNEAAWFNYVVCRTGGAESNTRIASAAQDRGWKWNPYGPGFTDASGDLVPVKSERDVFELLGLDYLEPWER